MKYLLRMLRYILKMAIILAVVFVLLSLTGTLNVEPGRLFEVLFMSKRGLILLGALVFLAAIYPMLAFTKMDVRANIAEARENLLNAFASCGYEIVRENDRRIIFRPKSFIKRLRLEFSDEITVTPDGNFITLEGVKKELVKIEARFRALNSMD